jgi:biopolymer transport protein ExbD
MYFNGEMVTQESLKERLMPLGRETSILVRADRNITLQRFVDVADILKQLNFTRIAVQTKDRT